MHASTPQELLPDAIDFAGFRLDSVRAELTREGQVVPLRPKVYQLLSYLAAHAGRTVPKRELLGAVWPDVVVTDDSLSQCIGELRAALGDSAQSLVKTVPRLGYRFDAPVVAGSQALVAPTDLSGSSTDDDSAPHQPRRRRTRWSLGIGVMAIAALCLGPATLRPTPLGIDAALALGRSVTVIAFADLSEPQAPHFAEGITQEIVTDLGSLQDATVVSSGPLGAGTSIAAIDIQRIGRELGVRHVLTGSVRREGERVQIQVQMSRTDTAGLEWSQRFDYPNVVDWNWRADISQRVAASLDARLLDSAVLLAWQDARSSAATDEWMRGSYLLQRYTTRAELLQARGHFEAALAADPRSINALSDLAGTYINEVIGRWAPDRHAALDKAKEYARRAIALDPNHGKSLRALGNAYMSDNEFDAAYPLFVQELKVTPNAANAHRDMAALLVFTGRYSEAEPYARTALRLDPLGSPNAQRCHALLGQALMAQHRDDAAIEEFRLAEAAAPTVPFNHFMLAAAEAQRGHADEARRELAEGLRLSPGATVAGARARATSNHPRYIAGLSWMYDGLRLAGLPEGAPTVATAASDAPR